MELLKNEKMDLQNQISEKVLIINEMERDNVTLIKQMED